MNDEAPILLLATDGSPSAEEATALAIGLARATGDTLHVVTAWRELHGDFGVPLTSLFPDLAEVEREHAEHVVDEVVQRARNAGVAAYGTTCHGTPADEICRVARERLPRMIVIGSHGWATFERAVLGSVSSAVLHRASCPVLVVRRRDDARTGAPVP